MRTIALFFLLGCSLRAADTTNAISPHEDSYEASFAKACGWATNLNRGREIIQQLLALSPEALEKLDRKAYCGERVAFIGVAAPVPGSNDLLTEHDFYLRVINKKGKDLRPKSVWWEVIVCGKILRVLPKNKIIVIEVDEPDWKIIQTG